MKNSPTKHTEIENQWITLKDGRRLSARIWLPKNVSENNPAPAILEYLPYRKRDGTTARDECTYPAFAENGYVGVRVDTSGNGESDGCFDDEYSPQEHSDALEVIDWIVAQPWCSGNIGMMGISWGGFNSLQLASLQPDALKAVIAIGTTVDRYNDDIHYKNGCQLYSNFTWSSTMLCFAARPPDPLLVGSNWKDTWLKRLQTQPFPLENWLMHQHKDDFWKHGSVGEDYSKMTIPSLVISGWCDAYVNAPPAMLENSQGITKAINGPWIHKYPHFAYPEPRMDFIFEATKWWDQWLKGESKDVESLPAYRAFISENIRPSTWRGEEQGRWVAEAVWPSSNIENKVLFLNGDHSLNDKQGNGDKTSICSPQDCGTACGEIFTLKPDSELSGDQRIDDAGSLVFDTEVLSEHLEILGRPELTLQLSINKPVGNIVVRLIDIHPDGMGHRVSWGVLNLSHRKSNETPEPMVVDQDELIKISLNECGYRFLPGHKIRVSISTAYWPMILPSPEVVTAKITLGESSSISLPIRLEGSEYTVEQPADKTPLPEYKTHKPSKSERKVERDLQNNMTHYYVYEDTGEQEMPKHGLRVRHTQSNRYSISPDDPLSAKLENTFSSHMSRGDWNIRVETESSMHCDATHFHISAKVTAYDSDELMNERVWERSILRQLM